MSFSVTMPALGESVTEGTVTRWLKSEGEQVDVDEPLLEVSTDKVDTEIPSPAAGILQRIVVTEDETVEVGAELAVIGDAAGGGGGTGSGSGAAADAATASPDQTAQQEHDQRDPSDAATEQVEREQAGQDVRPEPEQPRVSESSQPEGPQPESSRSARQTAPEPRPEPARPSSGADGDAGGADVEGTPVTMPALGESVTEGTVTRWLKGVGDDVSVDEPLLEVSTDKVDTEIPSPVAGTLLSIAVGEDETVPVGAQLAVIGAGGPATGGGVAPGSAPDQAPQEQAPQEQAPQEQARTKQAQPDQPQPDQPQPDQPQPPTPQPAPDGSGSAPAATQSRDAADAGDGSAYVTPLVRKLATEHGVDLDSVTGTGVGGRIRKQDVLEAARAEQERAEQERTRQEQGDRVPTTSPASPAPSPGSPAAIETAPAPALSPLRGTVEKMSRLRSVIAQRMAESLQVSAQLTTVVEVDVTPVARLRERAKRDFEAREGARLSFLPFFAKATVDALKAHPKLNASIDTAKGEITYFDAEHLGIAVDTDRGLLVPVIRDAGDLNIAGLARKINDLAERTRNNKITPDELGGGTFTLTNTGSRGALFDTPIINQPQVGILGTGSVVKRPVVVTHPDLGETIAVRSMAYLALTYDHRLVDGADAARFLTTVKSRLEEARFEADLGL